MNAAIFRSATQVSAVFAFYLACTMLLPALVDLWKGNDDWEVFAFSAFLVGVPAALIAVATRGTAPRVSVRYAIITVNMLWLTFAVAGMVPLMLSSAGLDLADAFFESVSGITTTGSTVMSGLDTMAPGILLWRALLQWFGGIGVIALGLFILPYLRIGSTSMFRIESSDRSENPFARFRTYARWMIAIYVSCTLACALLYQQFGMAGFDAVCHAMATVSTGGFGTKDTSFIGYQDLGIQWTAIVFMLLGATPFTALILLAMKASIRQADLSQVRFMIAACGVLTIALAVHMHLTGRMAFGDGLTAAAFNIVSLTTTTGFASADYLQWGGFAGSVFLLTTVLGGCSGSTSGGIKAYRWLIAFRMIRRSLETLVHPHAVGSVRWGHAPVEEQMQQVTVLFFTTYFLILLVGTMALTALGMDLMGGFSATLTALGNVGPGLTAEIGPVGNFAGVSDPAKLLLAFLMLLGRLELFAVLVVVSPRFWTSA